MKTMALFAAMTILFAVTVAHAQEQGGPAELDALKGKYEQVQAAMDGDFAKAQSDALATYGKALDAYMEYLKGAGQLQAYLELEKEKTRFEAEQTVASENRKSPYAIKAAAEYDVTIAEATADHQQKTARLLRQYAFSLNRLIKELMQSNRIEEAKAVQIEIGRCEFLLADIESKMPEPKKAEPGTVGKKIGLREDVPYTIAVLDDNSLLRPDRNYRIVKFPLEMKGASYLLLKSGYNSLGLNGEVIVYSDCTAYVAVMWRYLGKVVVSDDAFRKWQEQGWKPCHGTFETTTAGSEEWLWKVICKRVRAGERLVFPRLEEAGLVYAFK